MADDNDDRTEPSEQTGSEPTSSHSQDSTDHSNPSNPSLQDDKPPIDETDWEASHEERVRARARRRAERMDERRHRHARKERVLHTRISEQLSDDIRRLAEDLRVPTSNLVRNVLEEVFTVVENITDDVGELFEEVLDEAGSARDRIRRRHRGSTRRRHRRGGRTSWADVAEAEIRKDERTEETASPSGSRREPAEFPDVIGWQPLVLNHTGECAECARSLRRGTRAFVGVTEKGLSRNTLCRDCLQDR
jgi:hypothetical protein